MSRHPIDVLKAALQEAKTEAATLRIKTATLAKERNVVIEERNKARARVKELEQQNAVQRENVAEAMRENPLRETLAKVESAVQKIEEHAAKARKTCNCDWCAALREVGTAAALVRAAIGQPAGAGGSKPEGSTALRSDPEGHPPRSPEARIRELEAEVQRLQQDRAQVGAFGFKPLGIR